MEDQRLRGGSGGAALPLAVLLAGFLLALAALALSSVREAEAAVDKRAVSKARKDNGFPLWYQDSKGRRLELCVKGPPLCLASRRQFKAPEGEAFWWNAEAQMGHVGKGGEGRARLVLAVEAAFANARERSRIAFGRVRVRADNLRPRTRYKVLHPYGVLKLRTDARGELRYTKDVGANAPRKFGRALRSGVFKRFLRWNPETGRKAPRGFIGNPNVPHRVVGSPRGTNFFRIQGPNVGGKGDNKKTTARFFVQGKRG